jgi:hypothetical protein
VVSEQSARYPRSFGGLVGAILLLVVLVVGWVAVRSLLAPDESTPEPSVDYAQVVPQARRAAAFDLVAPTHLPAGWRATSVRFTDGTPQHWHLGVLTAAGRYVGLEQGGQAVAPTVEEYVDPAATHGSRVEVAGRPWSTYTDGGGDLALVRRDHGTTTLVVGHDVPRTTLVSYAAGLR